MQNTTDRKAMPDTGNKNTARVIAAVAFLSIIAETWLMLVGTLERDGDFVFALIVFFVIGFGAMVAASDGAQKAASGGAK